MISGVPCNCSPCMAMHIPTHCHQMLIENTAAQNEHTYHILTPKLGLQMKQLLPRLRLRSEGEASPQVLH